MHPAALIPIRSITWHIFHCDLDVEVSAVLLQVQVNFTTPNGILTVMCLSVRLRRILVVASNSVAS